MLYPLLCHFSFDKSTVSDTAKYWNGLNNFLSIASGNLISPDILSSKNLNISWLSFLSGVAVNPNNTLGL